MVDGVSIDSKTLDTCGVNLGILEALIYIRLHVCIYGVDVHVYVSVFNYTMIKKRFHKD